MQLSGTVAGWGLSAIFFWKIPITQQGLNLVNLGCHNLYDNYRNNKSIYAVVGLLLIGGLVAYVVVHLKSKKLSHIDSIIYETSRPATQEFATLKIPKSLTSEPFKGSRRVSHNDVLRVPVQSPQNNKLQAPQDIPVDNDTVLPTGDQWISICQAVQHSAKASEVVNNFYSVALIVQERPLTIEIFKKEITTQGLYAYVHLGDWNGQERGLIASLENGIGFLHKAVVLAGPDKLIEVVDKATSPCFHGYADVFQALALEHSGNLGGVLDGAVLMHSAQSPQQRAGEFIRVYARQRAMDELSLRGQEPTNDRINQIQNEELFFENYVRVDQIKAWCVKNNYIGYDTTELNNRGQKMRLHSNNIEQYLNEVLSSW